MEGNGYTAVGLLDCPCLLQMEDHVSKFNSAQCFEVLNALMKKGINFVAVDFDLTLINVHTSGEFRGSSKDLAMKIRPCFLRLVPCLLDGNIAVAVVTFSAQTELIREAIQLAFPLYWSKIVIRARDKTWGDMGDKAMYGKQKFLASAAEESERIFQFDIARNSTLLIDDDQKNIRIALRNKVQALLFIPDNPNSVLSEIVELGRF